MKRVYKYEVFVLEYSFILEDKSETFNTLKEAKDFILKNESNKAYLFVLDRIFKYEERNGKFYRYVKRVWFNKNGKWHSTRKRAKYKIEL